MRYQAHVFMLGTLWRALAHRVAPDARQHPSSRLVSSRFVSCREGEEKGRAELYTPPGEESQDNAGGCCQSGQRRLSFCIHYARWRSIAPRTFAFFSRGKFISRSGARCENMSSALIANVTFRSWTIKSGTNEVEGGGRLLCNDIFSYKKLSRTCFNLMISYKRALTRRIVIPINEMHRATETC